MARLTEFHRQQVSAIGASTSSTLSLLMGYHIKFRLSPLYLPSLLWGFTSKGVGWLYAASGCTFIGTTISSKGGRRILLRLGQDVPLTPSPHSIGKSSEIVGG
jgi:hypothetical protein